MTRHYYRGNGTLGRTVTASDLRSSSTTLGEEIERETEREESRRNELESAIQLESFPRSTSVRKISKRCDVWRFHDLRQSSCHAYL